MILYGALIVGWVLDTFKDLFVVSQAKPYIIAVIALVGRLWLLNWQLSVGIEVVRALVVRLAGETSFLWHLGGYLLRLDIHVSIVAVCLDHLWLLEFGACKNIDTILTSSSAYFTYPLHKGWWLSWFLFTALARKLSFYRFLLWYCDFLVVFVVHFDIDILAVFVGWSSH